MRKARADAARGISLTRREALATLAATGGDALSANPIPAPAIRTHLKA